MQQTLFVTNLPSQTTDMDLETIFSRHGRVVRAWLQPAEAAGNGNANRGARTGSNSRATRKGFVEMHPEDADQVIWILNGSWYKNRQIDVQNSAMRKERSQNKERSVYIASRY